MIIWLCFIALLVVITVWNQHSELKICHVVLNHVIALINSSSRIMSPKVPTWFLSEYLLLKSIIIFWLFKNDGLQCCACLWQQHCQLNSNFSCKLFPLSLGTLSHSAMLNKKGKIIYRGWGRMRGSDTAGSVNSNSVWQRNGMCFKQPGDVLWMFSSINMNCVGWVCAVIATTASALWFIAVYVAVFFFFRGHKKGMHCWWKARPCLSHRVSHKL